MSRLYATINESARKNAPTARAHRAVAATVKSWGFAVTARIDRSASDIESQDRVELSIRNLRTGEQVTIAADEIGKVFAQELRRQRRRDRQKVTRITSARLAA